MPKLLRANQTFVPAIGEGETKRVIEEGMIIPATDPVVKGREHLFTDLDEVIERATAAPGERRPVGPGAAVAKAAQGESSNEGETKGITNKTHGRKKA